MAEGRIAQYISHEMKLTQSGQQVGSKYVAVKVNYEGRNVTWRGFGQAVTSFEAALAEENPLTYGQWREWTVQLGTAKTAPNGQTYENTNLLSVGIVAKAPQNVPAPAAAGRRGGGGGGQPRSPVETESIERQTALNHAVRSVGKYFEFCGAPPEDHSQWIEHVLHQAESFAEFIHRRRWSEGDENKAEEGEPAKNNTGLGNPEAVGTASAGDISTPRTVAVSAENEVSAEINIRHEREYDS